MSIEIEWKPCISEIIIWRITFRGEKDMEKAEIGSKLREARLAANLTWEQAAERLNVSRETLSNWESGSDCPDIASITRMSKLYKVSLDDLLQDYPKTGTNACEGKMSKIILPVSYLLIWIITVVMYFIMDPGDAMGYSLVFFWGVLPVTTFVVSIIIGLKGLWGKLGLIAPVILGVMYMLADLVTFRLSHMIDQNTIDSPKFIYFIAGTVISFIGLGIGLLIKRLRKTH